MGARAYVSAIDNISIGTAVQDLWLLKAGSAVGIQLRWIQLSAAGVSTAAEIRLRLKRSTGAITNGSAGTAPAINPVDSSQTLASTSTVRANDTTQATGTFTGLLKYFQWNVLLPFDYMPGPEDADRPECQASQGFVLDLPAVIAAATTISSFAVFLELP